MKLKLLNAFFYTFFFCLGMNTVEATPKIVTVKIAGMKFVPEKVQIAEGDTVIWENADIVPHSATSNTKAFDSGLIEGASSWKFTFSKKGNYNYICKFHPAMLGSVLVD